MCTDQWLTPSKPSMLLVS